MSSEEDGCVLPLKMNCAFLGMTLIDFGGYEDIVK